MKKFITRIKAKEQDEKPAAQEKKAKSKEQKSQTDAIRSEENQEPRDLFWDDYSDLGYC